MRLSKLTSVKTIALMLMLLSVKTASAQEVYVLEEKPLTVQLRTNALYWAALSPNIGIELQTDMGYAFLADYVGAWWNSNKNHRYWSNYAFHVEGRYYIGHNKQATPYYGHHVGLYGIMATYDFEFGSKGYQSNDLSKTWSVGVSYGWSKVLDKNFTIDFTVGLGYIQSKYDIYVPKDDKYIRTNSKKFTFFGPSKLEASLVWNINNKNYK